MGQAQQHRQPELQFKLGFHAPRVAIELIQQCQGTVQGEPSPLVCSQVLLASAARW